jgi:hypothetical protein
VVEVQEEEEEVGAVSTAVVVVVVVVLLFLVVAVAVVPPGAALALVWLQRRVVARVARTVCSRRGLAPIARQRRVVTSPNLAVVCRGATLPYPAGACQTPSGRRRASEQPRLTRRVTVLLELLLIEWSPPPS